MCGRGPGALLWIVAAAAAVILPSACSSTGPRPWGSAAGAGGALPAWYLAPPADSLEAYFGVGAADALLAAKSRALLDVGSKLAISIRATYRDRVVLENNELHETIESEIEAHVRHRSFAGYSVEQSALVSGTFYALVRVDRHRLFRDRRAAFEELDWQIDSRLALPLASDLSPGFSPHLSSDFSAQLADPAGITALDYYRAYRATSPDLDRARVLLGLLRTLDPDFDDTPYRHRYRRYRERYESVRSGLAFTLVPDERSRDLGQVVQELLLRAGFESRIGVAGACPDIRKDICVEISSRATSRYAARRYMSILSASFRVRDREGAVQAASEHEVRGTALAGYPEATRAAMESLRSDFSKEGILAALGL